MGSDSTKSTSSSGMRPHNQELNRSTDRTLFFVLGIACVNLLVSFISISNTSRQPLERVNSNPPYDGRDLLDVHHQHHLPKSFYTHRRLSPLFGIEAVGIDLNDESLLTKDKDRFIAQLKQDLVDHRAILFRSQNLSGDRQVNISKALGDLDAHAYRTHPKSPHPLIYRISNNETEGFPNGGVAGWHNDGTHLSHPHVYQTMYLPRVVKGGNTHFMPLKELIDSFSAEEKEYFSNIWINTDWGKGLSRHFHPMVSKHPLRKDELTMLFSNGGGKFSWYFDNENATKNVHDISSLDDVTKLMQPVVTKNKLAKYFNSKLDTIGMRMEWQNGDFLIIDNIGLSHHASKGVVANPKDVGLRILHRTTIGPPTELGGKYIPTTLDGRKSFELDEEKMKHLRLKTGKLQSKKNG